MPKSKGEISPPQLRTPNKLTDQFVVPASIQSAGSNAKRRFVEFFTANIRNLNTRQAYHRAVVDFLAWCDDRNFGLHNIEPVVVAAYVEYQSQIYSAPTVKQHLAAIRMLFDWLVIGQIIPMNPASSVRGPKHIVKCGKTPVLTAEQARRLLDSIDASKPIGLRDRALIGVMVYSFARVTAVVSMNRDDYITIGKRSFLRFNEKGSKHHEVPAHRKAVDYLDELIASCPNKSDKAPLFRTMVSRNGNFLKNRMSRQDALRMIKRRATAISLPKSISCHTFRATGITAYLQNGGNIENAQAIAGHESPRTTKLYDRSSDEITLDEIERIKI